MVDPMAASRVCHWVDQRDCQLVGHWAAWLANLTVEWKDCRWAAERVSSSAGTREVH